MLFLLNLDFCIPLRSSPSTSDLRTDSRIEQSFARTTGLSRSDRLFRRCCSALATIFFFD